MNRESLGNGAVLLAAQLREQLAVVAAACQVLERAQDKTDKRSYLALMERSICRMLRLIGRLELAHCITEEDEVRLHPEELELGAWLAELTGRAGRLLSAAGIELKVHGPGVALLYADRFRLEEMLLEQLAYASQGSRTVELRVTDGEDGVTLVCRGDGQAAPEPELEEVPDGDPFDPAQGLQLALEIAELHGGTMTRSAGVLETEAFIPKRPSRGCGRLESPTLWQDNGIDPALIALSDLLPEEQFLRG